MMKPGNCYKRLGLLLSVGKIASLLCGLASQLYFCFNGSIDDNHPYMHLGICLVSLRLQDIVTSRDESCTKMCLA